jgi:hypothetical protein
MYGEWFLILFWSGPIGIGFFWFAWEYSSSFYQKRMPIKSGLRKQAIK